MGGQSLLEFLPSVDQQRFRSVVETARTFQCSGEDKALAVVMHVPLIDAMRNSINVEIFYLQDSGGSAHQPRYFVGMREGSETTPISELRSKPKFAPRLSAEDVPSAEDAASDSDESRARAGSCSASQAGTSDISSLEDAQAFAAARRRDSFETSFEAKTISIVAALRRWNLKEKEEDCCSLHAAVLETQRVMNTLMHRRCKNLIPSANVFCSVCNTFGAADDGEACDICASDLFDIQASSRVRHRALDANAPRHRESL